MTDFRTDEKGKLIMQPVTDFAVTDLAGTDVFLSLQYRPSAPAAAQGVLPWQGQFVLTPELALDLAEKLKMTAERALRVEPGTKLQ